MKLIGNGAEAKIYLDEKNNKIIKRRISKTYRIPEIDSQLRKQRTRREARILKKLKEFSPAIIESDDINMEISMEYIDGPTIKNFLEKNTKKQRQTVMRKIGEKIAKMHLLNVTHGDLTTSNMILTKKEVKIIDFGLALVTDQIEHKAVDIHLLQHSLESKHHQHYEELFKNFLIGYKKNNKDYEAILKRYGIVEKRGRYKRRMGS